MVKYLLIRCITRQVGFVQRFFQKPDLTDDENLLVKLMEEGITRQKQLLEASGMNPVKFNRVFRGLEEKKIAVREPRGRENNVRLL